MADAVKLRQFRRALTVALRSQRHASGAAFQADRRLQEAETLGKLAIAGVKNEQVRKVLLERIEQLRQASWDSYLKLDSVRFEVFELAELLGAETGE